MAPLIAILSQLMRGTYSDGSCGLVVFLYEILNAIFCKFGVMLVKAGLYAVSPCMLIDLYTDHII
jgi:hypothetical protein